MPENYITIPAEQGRAHIAMDVIAEIVGTAIRETEGVAGLKHNAKGVGVSFKEGAVCVEASIYAKYGNAIAAVGERVQRAAAAAVTSMTGLPSRVNVCVAGVTFDK